MASTAPSDILQYFHAAKTELYENVVALKPAQMERLCKKALELASGTTHSKIVEEFAATCAGSQADAKHKWLLRKVVMDRTVPPSELQILIDDIADYIAEYGQPEASQQPATSIVHPDMNAPGDKD